MIVFRLSDCRLTFATQRNILWFDQTLAQVKIERYVFRTITYAKIDHYTRSRGFTG